MLSYENDEKKVHALALGPLRTNCFIVENSEFSFLIDPVGEADVIADYLSENSISISFCMATHGHFDHVGAAAQLIEKGLCNTLYIHADDAVELRRCNTYSLLLDKKRINLPKPENIIWFDDAFDARLAAAGFKVEHLPSHTAGSAIFYTADLDLIFSGDIILKQANARKNRCKVGESADGIFMALRHISTHFRPDTLVFPGHGKVMRLDSEFALKEELQENQQ